MLESKEKYIGRKFSTVFVTKGEVDRKMVLGIIKYCKILDSEGLTPGTTGNVSVRVDNSILITAGGKDLGKLEETDIVKVIDYNEGKNIVTVAGDKEPSSETRMHWLIYRQYPEINAVIHVHNIHLLDKEKIKKSNLLITKREYPYGKKEQAREVTELLKKSNYVIIKNHGSVIVGKDLKEAFDRR